MAMVLSASDTVVRAAAMLERGEVAAAETILGPLTASPVEENADALQLMGLIRVYQSRPEEGILLLSRSLALDPNQPHVQLNLGRALAWQGRWDDAIQAFRSALLLEPEMLEARFELADALYKTGALEEAEKAFRNLLAATQGFGPAKLSLGAVLLALDRAEEAEELLAGAIEVSTDRRLLAGLHCNLAVAQRRRHDHLAALDNFEQSQRLDPARHDLDLARAETMQDLRRYEEALDLYRQVLARDPTDQAAHSAYNDLLYRMGREDEFLASYDRAPPLPALQIAKANTLVMAERSEKAHAIFASLLARDPGNRAAAIGAATTLVQMKRYDEAEAIFEDAIRRDPENPDLCFRLCAALLRKGDPQKAAFLTELGLRQTPADQLGLALLGSAWRMMGDERDEELSGYDSLIRTFDLPPPEGFSSMTQFNIELAACLDQLHPPTREYLAQSLRGGSQTSGRLFGTGHDLIERLQVRIREAVGNYIAELPANPSHPFLSRRSDAFRYCGSWSSRLTDGGYHTNHLHREGWISSCYYVQLPQVVADGTSQQGWIAFGQPDFQNGPAIRRTIQPKTGRLILFPSYTWHGTLPFQGTTPRTTIAFDALPA
jgi:tetratricopeptide (TPR) repeat protein